MEHAAEDEHRRDDPQPELRPLGSSISAIRISTTGAYSAKLSCARIRAVSRGLAPSPTEIFVAPRTWPSASPATC
ncbi:MAG: hypothetical protein WDN44_09440 [Sphingomonas sp.]